MIKLSVGVTDIAHLRDLQQQRARTDPPLRHRTRSFPRQAPALLEGGSIYWVIAGAVQARQRLDDIRHDSFEDGSACAALVLNPELVPVVPRPVRPFQGWRYLTADRAPLDIGDAATADGTQDMPAELLHALRVLCLL